MKTGWFELSPAETATSLVHPFKVPDLKRRPQFEKNLNWRKSNRQSQLLGPAIRRLAGQVRNIMGHFWREPRFAKVLLVLAVPVDALDTIQGVLDVKPIVLHKGIAS